MPEGGYKVSVTDTVHTCKADTAFKLRSPENQLQITSLVRDALCGTPNSGTISVTVSGGTAVGYTWLDRNNNLITTTPVFGQAAPGQYNVQIVDTRGCKANLDSIRVGLDSTGFARLAPDTLKCIGSAVVLAPLSGDSPGNVYQWSTGASSPTISVAQPGSYSLVVRNTITGCVGRSNTQVGDRPAPRFSLPPQASLCEGDQEKTQIAATGQPGLAYLWLTRNDTTQAITVDRAGNYQLRVTDPLGCTAVGVTRVLNLCEPRLSVPDAFTPNNDNLNDVLQVFTAYITDYEFRIYNRWGEVIFVSNNPETKWDGTYKGVAYPSMLYPYVVTYKSESFPERSRVVKRGTVMVIR